MGQMKRYLEDWLERFGWELGYDMANVPELGDLDAVASDRIDAETYWNDKKEEMKNDRS